MTPPDWTPDIVELRSNLVRLTALFNDPHPGLVTWQTAVANARAAIANDPPSLRVSDWRASEEVTLAALALKAYVDFDPSPLPEQMDQHILALCEAVWKAARTSSEEKSR